MQKVEFSSFELPKGIQEQVKRRRREVLEDTEVKEFIKEHRLDDQQIDRFMAKFFEFCKLKDDKVGKYKGILEHNDGQVQVRWEVKDIELAKRLDDGVVRSLKFDDSNKRLRGLTFSDLEDTKENGKYIRSFYGLVKEYRYKDGTNGIWLRGRYGIGKTYLLGAVANSFYRKGASVILTSVDSMLESIRESFDYERGLSKRKVAELKKVEVLILDDMGAERLTQWGYNDVLYPILNHRMNNNLLTFFTSNLSIDDYLARVAQSLGSEIDAERLGERLRVLAREFTMEGENRRR